MTKKPRILYVLGLAYSGSTIFGLTIGRHSKVLNLGEIVNLENNYGQSVQCTCGEKLNCCTFWVKVRGALTEQQKNIKRLLHWDLTKEGKRSFLEEKSDFSRLKILFGRSSESVYGKSNIDAYMQKNEELFSVIQSSLKDVELIVDLSKTHERLEILSKSKKLDVWVIYLTRDVDSVYFSNIKRPKKSRSRWGPKVLREALLQRLRTSGCEKIFQHTNPNKRLLVSYDEFTNNLSKVIDNILNAIGIESECIDYSDAFSLKKSGQHLYVGNRWLFRNNTNQIKIDQFKEKPKLSLFPRLVAKIFLSATNKSLGNAK